MKCDRFGAVRICGIGLGRGLRNSGGSRCFLGWLCSDVPSFIIDHAIAIGGG